MPLTMPIWFARLTTAFGTAFLAALLLLHAPARADLRIPTWWDPDGVGVGQDWHYRVPVTMPSTSSVNSTATVDIAFNALLSNLGISAGTTPFDINSVRVVRPNGTLAAVQQFTDRRFGNVTDAANNGAGEVRWIVQDGGTQTYYIYFDITANGAKSPNPQPPINGNFEFSATGQEDPIGWSGSKLNGFDAEVRPNENVTVTDAGRTRNTTGGPNTGNFSYLMGRRTNAETQFSILNSASLARNFTVPSTNPGVITIRYRVEGWGSAQNSNTNTGDYLQATVTNGFVSTQIISPVNNEYIIRPFSPNLGISPATTSNSGSGQYNGFDTTTTGVHTAGGTIPNGAEPWITASIPLNTYAGNNVSIEFLTYNSTGDRSWVHIDDVEWSVVTGTAGAVEAFGTDIENPNTLLTLTTGQSLPPITARVDARPTGSVTANLYDDSNMLRSSSLLFNDGAHGDGAANDAIWGNDGTDGANPLPSVPTTGVLPSLNWSLRIFARDNSVSTLGAANNGLVHRNGLPNGPTQANYWNIDQSTVRVFPPDVRVTKTARVVSDPVSSANFKNIPGAVVEYCMTIRNLSLEANNIVASDILPSDVTYRANSMRSRSSCTAAAAIFEDDDDDDSDSGDTADGVTASYNAGATTVTVNRAILEAGAEFAVTFEVQVD